MQFEQENIQNYFSCILCACTLPKYSYHVERDGLMEDIF